MPGAMNHSPAHVLRQLLVDLGLGGQVGGTWPAYVSSEPDSPDSALTVYNTASRDQGTTGPDGEVQELHGVQVRVRAADDVTGWAKARSVAVSLDAVSHATVTVTRAGTTTSTYLVDCVVRNGDVRSLGKDSPTSKRNLYTIDLLVAVRQTAPTP